MLVQFTGISASNICDAKNPEMFIDEDVKFADAPFPAVLMLPNVPRLKSESDSSFSEITPHNASGHVLTLKFNSIAPLLYKLDISSAERLLFQREYSSSNPLYGLVESVTDSPINKLASTVTIVV